MTPRSRRKGVFRPCLHRSEVVAGVIASQDHGIKTHFIAFVSWQSRFRQWYLSLSYQKYWNNLNNLISKLPATIIFALRQLIWWGACVGYEEWGFKLSSFKTVFSNHGIWSKIGVKLNNDTLMLEGVLFWFQSATSWGRTLHVLMVAQAKVPHTWSFLASEVIISDGVEDTTATSSFSDSRYVRICCNLDICYLLSTPLFWQKWENAREKGKEQAKRTPERIAEFFYLIFLSLRKVSL